MAGPSSPGWERNQPGITEGRKGSLALDLIAAVTLPFRTRPSLVSWGGFLWPGMYILTNSDGVPTGVT